MRTSRTTILAAIVFIIVFIASIAMSHAQTTKSATASATISKEVKQPEAWKGKTKKIGSTIVPDSTTIFKGSRGGLYFYKWSEKCNRILKVYIAKSVK
jgi:hypothetical protein